MRENYTLKNYSLWIAEGVFAGILAGLTVAVYRFALRFAENNLSAIWNFIRGNALYIVLWFLALLLLAVTVGALLRIDGHAGGSGLAQLAAEANGRLDPCWWRVILVKIPASMLCFLGGLSLGQAGPSIHLGAMAAKGVSHLPGGGREKTENRRRLLFCGAGAGLAATFHIPLAGLLFILEELRYGFDLALVVTGMAATASADIVTRICFGEATLFSYQPGRVPVTQYWILLLLGILLGLAGAFYNFSMRSMQLLFKRFKNVPMEVRLMIPFLMAGVLGLVLPQVLASGKTMGALLKNGHPAIPVLFLLLLVKFIFSVVCTGSGAPGGIFSPMFAMGAYMGAIFGDIASQLFAVNADLWQQFIILGMAGFFSAIFRLPLTAVAITAEITGSIVGLPDIIVVSLIAYATANLTRTRPIIRELLFVMEYNR